MNPFVPFRIACRVGLLVFWLENTHYLTVRIPCKVAARAALRNHARMDLLPYSHPYAIHDGLELGLVYDARLFLSQSFWGDGTNALGRLKDRMMYFEPLFLSGDTLAPAALEL